MNKEKQNTKLIVATKIICETHSIHFLVNYKYYIWSQLLQMDNRKKKQFPYMNNNLDCYLRISTGTIKRYTSNKTAFSILCVKITHIYDQIRCKTLYMWRVGSYTMICTEDRQNLISADDKLMNVRCKELMYFVIVSFGSN